MAERARIGLDNPAFSGRLRRPPLRSQPTIGGSQTLRPSVRYFQNDSVLSAQPAAPTVEEQPKKTVPTSFTPPLAPVEETLLIIEPQPFVKPAPPRQQRSQVLRRSIPPYAVSHKKLSSRLQSSLQTASKTQLILMGMACFVFAFGIVASVQTVVTNHQASAQVAALSRVAVPSLTGSAVAPSSAPITSDAAVPSTVKPSSAAIASYSVGPLQPKYLTIPKLGVHALILNLGVLKTGALATPPDVFETGWYNHSSLPGQPGAMLIDGHVSSWTSHGVFYNIKQLQPGDTMSVTRGDGQIFNYKVIKTQVFNAGSVDMQSAVQPVVSGAAGLNLITCDGQGVYLR
jgi:LPXTG-site transpeptidase (sortase) family protein